MELIAYERKLVQSRHRGCLLGGALGDALGYPIEFKTSASVIHRDHGTAAPAKLDYTGKGALISDDTQMTLFTADGVVRSALRFNEQGMCNAVLVLHRAYLRWLRTQQEPFVDRGPTTTDAEDGWLLKQRALWARRAPGNTCLNSLISGQEYSTKNRANNSKGCGAIMRSAPIGMTPGFGRQVFELAVDAGALTHGHPSGYLSAGYFASVINSLVYGSTFFAALDTADNLITSHEGHEEIAKLIVCVRELIAKGKPDVAAIESLGGGWVGEEALAIALLCAATVADATPQSVAEALWRSVAHKGDSDSTGSLTGNLLGAMLGEACLPKAWLAELELAEVIRTCADDVFDAYHTERREWAGYQGHRIISRTIPLG